MFEMDTYLQMNVIVHICVSRSTFSSKPMNKRGKRNIYANLGLFAKNHAPTSRRILTRIFCTFCDIS